MDMSQYMDLFIAEATEHVRNMHEHIVSLEINSDDKEKVNSLFRLAHSIKGMAASMGYHDIAQLAHTMEDLLERIRKEEICFDALVADLLLEGADLLSTMLQDVETAGTSNSDIQDIVGRLAGFMPVNESELAEAVEVISPETSTPVQIKSQDLTEDSTKPELRYERRETRQTVRVKTEVLDHLVNVTGELITNKHRLVMIDRELGSAGLTEAVAELSKLLQVLHSEVMKVRLMPFAAIADRFPRMVRDLARKSSKEVVFTVEGTEIELDRGILEELSDPLVHLLRNAVDHGLETAAGRRAACKPAAGSIKLVVRREKGQVVLTIEDDGRGMDPEALIESAIERKLIKPEDRGGISPRQAFMLTCIPGFSTAKEVTDISGRGVGMDIVRSSILSLGGNLSIESELGKGSRITLRLPLTVAIIQVLLVTCASLIIGFPVMRIHRTLELDRSLISNRGRHKVFSLNNEVIPLFSLNRLLGVPFVRFTGPSIPVVITEMRGRKVGLTVDRFAGQQEVFIKPLGSPLGKLRGVAGGAILGDGKVVMILDTVGL
jgi:two-component system, chemotaxis family, sensor kinase CheA